NNTQSYGLVKFIVTPYTRKAHNDEEKCSGVNDTVYVWVEPTVHVNLSTKQDTICNKGAIDVTLTSDDTPTRDIRFKYVVEAPVGITVAPSSDSNLAENTTLTNVITNNTQSYGLVKFIVTPYTRKAHNDEEKCSGVNDTVYVWVEPTVHVNLSTKQDTICNKGAIDVTLTSDDTPTRDIRFRYVVESPAGITVSPSSDSNLAENTTLTNVITNNTQSYGLVKFIVTPYTRKAHNDEEKCSGVSDTVYIWVEPTVHVILTPKQDTICNNETIDISLTTNDTPTREARFRYTTELPVGVTVLPASGSNLSPGAKLSNVITNNNTSAQLVKIIVTPYTRKPHNDEEKCTGVQDTVYIWVEPTVHVTLSVKRDTVCNGDAVEIQLTTADSPVREARFRYVVLTPSGVTVTPPSGNNLAPGSTLKNIITNNNSSAQLVRFVITPYTRRPGMILKNARVLTIQLMYGWNLRCM
ncbi:MAG: hypothetical protein HC905_11985, partial [Bacteroidales bacterium]|nr:hypothetical protein [Bacteroidales bacterium]